MANIFNYCQNGNIEQVQLLLNQGIAINQRIHDHTRTGRTPLYVASKYGHVNIVQLLIQHGADINIQTLDERSTPLHIAIKNGKRDVVRELLTHNPNLTLRNYRGDTPLHFASLTMRSVDTFKELINHGAHINEKNNDGWTCLHWASRNGHVDIVRELVGKVNINETTNNGETALHIIAQECESWRYSRPGDLRVHKRIVELLYEYGIDTMIRDNNGSIAKDITNRDELKQLFESCELLRTPKEPGIE